MASPPPATALRYPYPTNWCGFWLWQVKSRDEVIEWVKRCPNPMPEDLEIEIRQAYGAEDFAAALTPELREQEEMLLN